MTASLSSASELAAKARTPFPGASDAYEQARQALLAEEIEFRRHMTRLVEQRRALPPGPVIGETYRFRDEQGSEVGQARLFWASEMTRAMADPGQDPRDAPDIASLWSILDLTPEGRGTDWYPKLRY